MNNQAVLHAINGGGQNMSRAMLTGALVNAKAGLSGISARFLPGLSDRDDSLKFNKQMTDRIET